MKLGVAGDTMLGRMVGERLTRVAPTEIVDRAVVEVAREADVFLLNLECAISDRGERWPDPDKPFFFRAPPVAVEVLRHLGVDVVTLANNHALDYGPVALLDAERNIVYLNPAAENLFAVSSSKLVGKHCERLIGPEHGLDTALDNALAKDWMHAVTTH